MLSVIDICNKALSLINVSNINDLSEGSAQARVCRFHYEICRDSVLREHPWGFARSFVTLASTDIEHPHWSYVYSIPGLYLYGINIFPADEKISTDGIFPDSAIDYYMRDADYRYELANMEDKRVILSNVPNAMMEYIKQITDVTLFDPHFVETLSYKMASDIAMPLTGDSKIAAFYTDKYLRSLQHAQVLSANESKHSPLLMRTVSGFTRSRR